MRFPAVLQQPRADDLAGHEEAHPHRPVRLPQSGVAKRQRRGQEADQRLPERRSGAPADHRPADAQRLDRPVPGGAADAVAHRPRAA